jgi:hypothetical protein
LTYLNIVKLRGACIICWKIIAVKFDSGTTFANLGFEVFPSELQVVPAIAKISTDDVIIKFACGFNIELRPIVSTSKSLRYGCLLYTNPY